jgi:hypothetical protein
MHCFWEALINYIKLDDMVNVLQHKNINKKPTSYEFVELLKNKSVYTENVTWNDEPLTKQQIQENFFCINQFNVKSIDNGYYCSIFDPFLFSICELFNISIEHNYNGHTIQYKNILNSKYHLKFKSDTGHFSCA